MTGPIEGDRPRRAARLRAVAAGALLIAYAVLLGLVGYLLAIESAAVLVPVAVALGVGVLGCVPVVVANLRPATGRPTARCGCCGARSG